MWSKYLNNLVLFTEKYSHRPHSQWVNFKLVEIFEQKPNRVAQIFKTIGRSLKLLKGENTMGRK